MSKITSIIVSPFQPRYSVKNVGYLQVNAQNKSLTIYDDIGNSKQIGSVSGEIPSSAINQLIDQKLVNYTTKQYIDNNTIKNININGTSGQIDENKISKITLTTCAKIPDSVNKHGKTVDLCNALINPAKGNAKVGMMYMDTVFLTDVPLDLNEPEWETKEKRAEILIKVIGDKVLQLELTSTSYGQRSWVSMYYNGNMEYGDTKCPWFAKLLSPISIYDESKASMGNILTKQYRAATEKYVDNKLNTLTTNSNIQQIVSSMISGYIKELAETKALALALSSTLISINPDYANTIQTKITDIRTQLNYQDFENLF